MVTVGLDRHKRCITACALDDAGTVVAEQLTARGFAVMVAHPYQVKLIWQARTKMDPATARSGARIPG